MARTITQHIYKFGSPGARLFSKRMLEINREAQKASTEYLLDAMKQIVRVVEIWAGDGFMGRCSNKQCQEIIKVVWTNTRFTLSRAGVPKKPKRYTSSSRSPVSTLRDVYKPARSSRHN